MSTESQRFFEENKYIHIKEFIPRNVANLLYEYTKTVVQAVDYKIVNSSDYYNPLWDGGFGDAQVPNTFYRYGDPMMDTIMGLTWEDMKEYTGLDLTANYTYWRFYQKNDILERHTDRGSCEISSTVCLGYDSTNVDQNVYPKYNWPMWVYSNGKEIPIQLEPGDCIIYRGIDVEHWREPYIGLNHAQVFMHYNDANGPVQNVLDGRPLLGIPKLYKGD